MDKEVLLHELNLQPGELNMSISGDPAKMFLISLIELFDQNGAENFLTTTVSYKGAKYAITIENCNGIDTPAEKLLRLEEEIKNLKSQLKSG